MDYNEAPWSRSDFATHAILTNIGWVLFVGCPTDTGIKAAMSHANAELPENWRDLLITRPTKEKYN